jgi:hypothetical protein
MRRLLQLAAIVALTATAAHAQISSPDKLVAPPPPNPALQAPRPEEDLQWLWQYVKPAPTGNKHDLLDDARFTALLNDNLKAPQAMWGTGVPLDEAARAFLSGEGEVASTDNRHLTITGCVVDHCAQRGLLYADLGERNPLVVFLALRWNEQTRTTDEPGAPFTLWVFPSRTLDPHQLPQPLKESFSAFTRGDGCKANNITNVIVVDPNGVPHILGTFEAGVMPVHCDTRPVFSTPRN